MRARFSFLLILQFFCLSLFAQTKVEGNVTDAKGTPIEGVTVTVKGSTAGVMTNNKGQFTITAAENATLVFSYVGFVTREEKLNNRSVVNVSLADDPKTLDNVVVVG